MTSSTANIFRIRFKLGLLHARVSCFKKAFTVVYRKRRIGVETRVERMKDKSKSINIVSNKELLRF